MKEGFKQVRHKVADKSEDKIVEAFVILEKEHGPKVTRTIGNEFWRWSELSEDGISLDTDILVDD